MAHALDLDDTSWAYCGHPTATIWPPILAVGEMLSLSGKELLTAFIVGVEVACRLGKAVLPSHYEMGWHSTATIGTIAAAAAVSKAIQLNVEKIILGLGIAVTKASGLKQNFGTMTKPLHSGMAAENGLMAAILAQLDVSATKEGLEGKWGFSKAFAMKGDYSKAFRNIGKTYSLLSPGIVFKQYASCTGTHPSIDATLWLVQNRDVNPSEISKIICIVPPSAKQELGFSIPKSGLEARFNLQFCIAIALLERGVSHLHFIDEKLRDKEVIKLMKKVTVQIDPNLSKGEKLGAPASTLMIGTNKGKIYSKTVKLAKGNPENPLSFDELCQKFRKNSMFRLKAKQTELLLETILNLENIADIQQHTKLFRAN
jgi:2-methylcitrate dehydratase PrpD